MTTPAILEAARDGRGEDVAREMRCRGLYSPYYFGKTILGHRDMAAHLHNHDLEMFTRRLLAGVRKQWIEWPRGFLKTSCFTVGFSIWLTLPHDAEDRDFAVQILGIPPSEWDRRMSLHNQDITQLMAFETFENACKKVGIVKKHFEENTLLRGLFPEIAYTGKERPWSEDQLRIRRTGKGTVEGEGTFDAIGVGGALQSRHYDVIWGDDLVGERAKNSRLEMQRTKDWHGLVHGVEKLGGATWRFGVSNRWGYDDLNSHVRNEEHGWQFYTRAAYELDAETGKETPIWPEMYPMEKILEKRASMSEYDFACQYLNAPRPPGERAVDTSKIHKYHVADGGQIVCDTCGFQCHPRQLQRYLHYDPYNAKGKGSKSAPAIVAVGCSTDRHVFLLDYFIGKGDYSQIYNKLFEFNDTWSPHKFTYEDVGAQNMCEFYIRQHQGRPDFTGRRFPTIAAVPTRGKPKEIRVQDYFFPVIERGKFACRPSQVAFLEMLETWPFDMPNHDYDLLDALAQGAAKDKFNNPIWRFPQADDEAHDENSDAADGMSGLGTPYSMGVRA